MPAASTANVDAKFGFERRKTSLQRPDHAGRYPGGMPVHSHYGSKRLEPKGVRQPLQEFIASIVMDDGLAQDCAKRGHAFCQPQRNAPAVKWKISAACPSGHWIESDLLDSLTQMEGGMPAEAYRSQAAGWVWPLMSARTIIAFGSTGGQHGGLAVRPVQLRLAHSDPRIPIIAAIFPIAAFSLTNLIKRCDSLNSHHELGHLVTELTLRSQSDRRSVGNRQRPVIHLIGENGLWMECINQIKAFVVEMV